MTASTQPASLLGSIGAALLTIVMLAIAALGIVALSRAEDAHAAETLEVPAGLRLLVVAPHPDDESLSTGGLMQRTLANGGHVEVLFMTSGDGYPDAVTAATGHDKPRPAEYRGFGELRRAEALVALEHYHVLPPAVSFLGFPDGGLAHIWQASSGAAYESPYTHESRPPYPAAFNPSKRYTRRELIRQTAHVIAAADPDWIGLPTPLDTHPDHNTTYAFVMAALKLLANEPGAQTKLPKRLLTYLVHDGAWPPPASVPGPLPEPGSICPSARWYSLDLTPNEVETKLAALESHRTQAAVMDNLFHAMARPNELFGVVEIPSDTRLTPITAFSSAAFAPPANPVSGASS